MFNITKQGSSLLITSNDNSQFPWKDGQMSLPMNSVVYVIDESDYIAFRSASNNDILFTALIDEIQINGTNVTKDDFILQFDNVANSAGGGGGSASAGVNSINGFQGDVNIKSINGESLIGSGDITIEGGSSGDVDLSDYYNKKELNYVLTTTYQNYNGYDQIITKGGSPLNIAQINGESILGKKESITLPTNSDLDSMVTNVAVMGDNRIAVIQKNGNVLNEIYFPTINNQQILGVEGNITIEYTAGDGISIADNTITNNGVTSINIGESLDESFQRTGDVKLYTNFYDGSYDVNINDTTFYGLKPIDNSIVIENAGGTANGNFRCGIKVNEWVGTQSEYDALGSYDSGCTYYITE